MKDPFTSGRIQAADDLLRLLGVPALVPTVQEELATAPWREWSPERCWAASGAQSLTAPGAKPPGDVAGRMNVAGLVFEALGRTIGKSLQLDGSALLGERAALATGEFKPVDGHTLRGHGRMLQTLDGWLAFNLPRGGDLDALPALTDGVVTEGDVEGLHAWARTVPSAQILEQAGLLALAVAAVPDPGLRHVDAGPPRPVVAPWLVRDLGGARSLPIKALQVVDFSGLWAGPLCTSLLAALGARVVRVSGSGRSETPAPHDVEFNELLAAGVERVSLDLKGPEVRKLVQDADIVVTSSRPAALHRLGMRERSGQTWIRITAHGAVGEDARRVGFGDDVAAAAGAVAYTPAGPTYAGDALADPITGLLAAIAAAGAVVRGRAAVIDLSLRRSAAWALGPDLGKGQFFAGEWPMAAPRARRVAGS